LREVIGAAAFGVSFVKPREVQLQTGQRLAQFVMYFAGDAAPFLFANRLQVSGQGAQLFAGITQSLLGPLAFRQVEHESYTLISAFLEGRHADQHGNAAAVFPEVLLLKRLQT